LHSYLLESNQQLKNCCWK